MFSQEDSHIFIISVKTLTNFSYKHPSLPKRIEYILELNLLEKNVKRPFCCTVSILQVYFTYLCYIIFWALEYHFIENLKLILKENQIMPFTFQTMISVISINQMMFFIHLINYLTALKNSKLNWIVQGTYCINVLYCI